MKKLNRCISLFLALCLLLTAAPAAVFAAGSGSGTQPDPDWFAASSTVYNHALAQTCANLMLLGFTNDAAVRTELQKYGFDTSSTGTVTAFETGATSVNHYISSCEIPVNGSQYTLVLACFSGTYGEQWFNNLDPGTGDTHAGVQGAADEMASLLRSYCTQKHLDPAKTKIVLCGHSRGAAVTNLVAIDLIDAADLAAPESIFAYAFASPNYVKPDPAKSYDQIFNIINPDDIFPLLLPAAWGFGKYGQTVYFPSKAKDANRGRNGTAATLQSIYRKYGVPDYFGNWEMTLMRLLSNLTQAIPTAEDYYETSVSSFARRTYGSFMPDEAKRLYASKYGEASLYTLLAQSLSRIITHQGETFGQEFSYAQYQSGTTLTLYDLDRVAQFLFGEAGAAAVEALAFGNFDYKSVLQSINVGEVPENSDFLYTYLLSCAAAVRDVFLGVIAPHNPSIYAECMNAFSEDELIKSGYTNLTRISGPVNVTVYDASHDLAVAARIENGVVDQTIAAQANAVTAYVEEGVITLLLPENGLYGFSMEATANGTVDLTAATLDGQFMRVAGSNCFGVPVQDGETVLGAVLDIEGASTAAILDEEWQPRITGTAVTESAFGANEIAVAAQGLGSVTGAGDHTAGDLVILQADCDENNRFLGYYENGSLVCDSPVYAFIAKESRSLTAKFTDVQVDVTGVKIDENMKTAYDVENGETVFVAKASVIPANTTEKRLCWTVSDPALASVSDTGVVTLLTGSPVVLTAKTPDGRFTDSVTINPAAPETVDSGTCGDNLTWTLDDAGTLTVSGTGSIASSPWRTDYCDQIKTVNIENGVTSIGENAFYNCTKLTTVSIPDGVTSIGAKAFYNCTSLTSITIPEGVTAILKHTFNNCINLRSLTIPASVNYVQYAFNNCQSLEEVHITDLTAWCGICFKDDDWDNYCNPLIWAHNLYLNDELITDLVIPDGVKKIGHDAFCGCSISSVSIPASVNEIEFRAFVSCPAFEVYITDLSAWCNVYPNEPCWSVSNFYVNGERVTDLVIPEEVTSIGAQAFSGLSQLKSVTIPNGVTKIGYCAFCNCTELAEITIPNSIEAIGHDAFSNTAWYNVQPEGLVYAGNVAYKFKGAMPEITAITLEEGTRGIAGEAFYGCTGLTEITIPVSVTSIGEYAFFGCTGLTGITIPDGVMRIEESTFCGCTGLSDITIGNGVNTIGEHAFFGCTELTFVILPESVTYLDYGVFYLCSNLTSVVLPKSLTGISRTAFYGCTGLTDVYYSGSEEEWNAIEIDAYDNEPLFNATIYFNYDPAAFHQHTPGAPVRENELHPTCTENGSYELATYCTVCGQELLRNDYELQALGHDFGAWTETLAPTCTAEGKEKRGCSRCEAVETRSIAALGHADQTIPAVAATCTKAGKTAGLKCSRCGVVLTAQTEIPALGHSYKDVLTKATLTADGKIVPTCTVCGATGAATKIAKASGISISKTKFVYNGKAQNPTLTVKDSAGKAIASKYYTVKWSNASSKAVGTYTVTITFKGNYSGSKTLTYTIVPKAVTGVKNAAPATKSVKLTWTKATGAKYYEIYGSTDGKTFQKITTVSTNSAKITKVNGKALAAGKTYYFKVRALDSTKKLIGEYSKVLKTGTLTAAPKITKLTSSKAKTATVTWGKVTGAKSYVVYKSTDGKKWTKAGAATGTSFTLTKLTGGKKIYVKVLAVNAYAANSDYSASKYVTVKK